MKRIYITYRLTRVMHRFPFSLFRRGSWVGTMSIAALLSLIAGCAKTPASTTSSTRAKTVTITLKYRGALNINKQPQGNYYFVVINRTDNTSDSGAVPTLAPNWGGNGIAAAPDGTQGFVGLVRYERNLTSLGGLEVDASTDAAGTLVNPTTLGARGFNVLGPPDRILSLPEQGGDANTISFQLDLGRLPNPQARYIQLNFISASSVPQGVENVEKDWDALGDGTQTGSINNWITIDTTQNPTISNDQQIGTSREPSSDVRDRFGPLVDDASLDLVDWTVQVRDP